MLNQAGRTKVATGQSKRMFFTRHKQLINMGLPKVKSTGRLFPISRAHFLFLDLNSQRFVIFPESATKNTPHFLFPSIRTNGRFCILLPDSQIPGLWVIQRSPNGVVGQSCFPDILRSHRLMIHGTRIWVLEFLHQLAVSPYRKCFLIRFVKRPFTLR